MFRINLIDKGVATPPIYLRLIALCSLVYNANVGRRDFAAKFFQLRDELIGQ